jgi:hypothetical protein
MNEKKEITWTDKSVGEECDTLFYQGNGCSQTQALKYVGNYKVRATTGETMWCTGRNNLPPLNVIYKLHLGCEIMDVNLHPFSSYSAMLNPVTLVGSAITWISNWRNGYHFVASKSKNEDSVRYHAPVFSQVSIGQETDMLSHQKKYDHWQARDDKSNGLILWGVSRGTAATFCAFAEYKYKEVKLVVLEGAIDSVPEVLQKRVAHYFKLDYLTQSVTSGIKSAFSFFNQHNIMKFQPNGPSPLKSVTDFPEGVPVVFITSKIDTIVPCTNTQNIARALADKGKNDVYLLTLERSSHPNYMFDDRDDHDHYERFIHAIYKKYNLKHDPELASLGEELVSLSTLHEIESEDNELRMAM